MKKEKNTIKETSAESGKFGPIYRQFKGKPKEAIKFLREKKEGECIAALHRSDIGDIDIVWGEITDSIKHKGFGLVHIIDKHESEINRLGFNLEENELDGKTKKWLLSAFDIIKRPKWTSGLIMFVTVKNIDADSLRYLRCMVKRQCKYTTIFENVTFFYKEIHFVRIVCFRLSKRGLHLLMGIGTWKSYIL